MRQRRKHLRFAFEAGQPFRIRGKLLRKNLEGDIATEPRIARTIHFAHAARPEQRDHLVGTEASPSAEHGIATDYNRRSLKGERGEGRCPERHRTSRPRAVAGRPEDRLYECEWIT